MAESAVAGVALGDLQAICTAREGAPEDAIDGVQPRWVAEPASVGEVSALLRLAHAHHLAVAPRGGGTKMAWGNMPTRVDLILSTARLNRVLEHAAGDLIARVEGGTRLRHMQETFRRSGQVLALDPPHADATIGGVIAANAAGPHRQRFGAMRDLLIGITYVLPDGTVARAGGKVVKNVAGYDLCKLFTGSLGTLGVIAEAIVRLHPLPAAQQTLLVPVRDAAALGAAVQTVLHSTLVPSALDFRWGERGGTLAVLFEGVAPGVEAQVAAARDLLRTYGSIQVLDEETARGWWREHTQAAASCPPEAVRLKISTVPHALPGILTRLAALGSLSMYGRAGLGIVYADLSAAGLDLPRTLIGLRAQVADEGGSVVVQHAPLPYKAGIDVWGAPEAGTLMGRVRAMFDPEGIMNPGRYIGGV